jgi:prolyl-tRNA editing enzyme YbaK/EbsC (Cys-tRNA(Pro) deacylase)
MMRAERVEGEMAVTGTASERIVRWLRERGIDFRLVPHGTAVTIAQEAVAARIPLEQTAQTFVLREGQSTYLAVLPACERLDLAKARSALGAGQALRKLREETASPPFGSAGVAGEVVDRRLLTYNRILCPAGDHEHSVLVDGDAVVRAVGAEVADICAA